MTEDVADSISTNPPSLHRVRPPAQTVASLVAISNGTQTNRNNRSASARLMRNSDVTVEPARNARAYVTSHSRLQIAQCKTVLNANRSSSFRDIMRSQNICPGYIFGSLDGTS